MTLLGGSEEVWDTFTPDIRSQAVYGHLRALWGEDTGFVRLALGSGPHRTGMGRYAHASWTEKFYQWPNQAHEILQWVRAKAPVGDVYYGPQLRVENKSASALKDGFWFWTDLDHEWDDHSRDVAKRFPHSRLIESGTNFHFYVKGTRRHSPDRIDVLNQALAKELGGDHNFSSKGLLRVPGTYNWKGFTTGGRPSLVRRVRGVVDQ